MNSTFAGSQSPGLIRLSGAVIALLAALAFWAPSSQAAPVTTDAVLLQTDPTPWDDEFNEEAMEAVFGSGWETQTFDAVQADAGPGGLFTSHVRFIWIEASDDSTEDAKEFVELHEAALEAFVARGGGLFINSATNQDLSLNYDGRSILMLNEDDFTDVAVAVNPDHPIFKGPAAPNATSFEGGSFAHGRVIGPGLTPLIIGTVNEGPVNDAVVLADYTSGSGRVALGSMTAAQHQEPEDAAKSLRINLIHYLLSPVPPPPPAPPVPPVPDTRKPKVKLTGVPGKCVEDGFRFRVRVSDESGVGAIRIKLGGKLLRKADGKGKPNRIVKARVPDAKLDHPGRYRISVVARDASGNVKRTSAAFKVCD